MAAGVVIAVSHIMDVKHKAELAICKKDIINKNELKYCNCVQWESEETYE